MTFADQVCNARRALGLTQAGLAARLDVDKQTVSNWECGRSTPWAKERDRVLALLLRELEPAAPERQRRRVLDRILGD